MINATYLLLTLFYFSLNCRVLVVSLGFRLIE